MTDMLLDRATAVLTKVLDGTAVRHRALANNIANAETPGYHRQDVDFASELTSLINRTTDNPSRSISAVQEVGVAVEDDETAPVHPNGNSVTIEREMTEVARNSLQYETAARMLTLKLSALRSAIHEGRR